MSWCEGPAASLEGGFHEGLATSAYFRPALGKPSLPAQVPAKHGGASERALSQPASENQEEGEHHQYDDQHHQDGHEREGHP
jgi:hypothetical protein